MLEFDFNLFLLLLFLLLLLLLPLLMMMMVERHGETRSFLKINVCLCVCFIHTHRTVHPSKHTRTQIHKHNPQFTMMIYSVVGINAYVSHIWAILTTKKFHFWHIPIDAISFRLLSLQFCTKFEIFSFWFCTKTICRRCFFFTD